MRRLDNGIAQKVPVLTRISEPTGELTVADLFNPSHRVNNISESGKSAGMSIIINGHIWVSEGSRPSDGWYRVQKHIESETAILRAINNTSVTTSNGSGTLVAATLDALDPVEPFLSGDWIIDPSKSRITYNGRESIFKFEVSGDVRTTDSSGTGDNISVSFYDSAANDGLTGATKILPITKVQGGTVAVVDFTLSGYARVNSGDYFQIEVGSDFIADLLVNNILIAATPLDTLDYL